MANNKSMQFLVLHSYSYSCLVENLANTPPRVFARGKAAHAEGQDVHQEEFWALLVPFQADLKSVLDLPDAR